MEGVPALPWAGDAGGRILLPKAVTYEQLAAGAVEFQLYNRNTNALIPTGFLRVGDHIKIQEKETGGDESPYTIDRYNGASSEIVLTGDGQATRIWGLMGASFNDDVIVVRSFQIDRTIAGDTWKLVSVEINGRMYIPYIEDGTDKIPVNYLDGSFEKAATLNYPDSNSIFPLVKVIPANDLAEGESSKFTIPNFDNVEVKAVDTIEVSYDGDLETNAPWRFGQDGIFTVVNGSFIRVNGVNRAIIFENEVVGIDDLGMSLGSDTGNIYKHPNATLIASCEKLGIPANWKENMYEDFGLEFGPDILISENINGEDIQPFVIIQ